MTSFDTKMTLGEYNLHVVLLAGGSGSRLSPLSTKNKPKQFLRLFSYNSLLQETIKRVSELPYTTIGISTAAQYNDITIQHIYELDSICNAGLNIWIDKEQKGTAAAIHSILCEYKKLNIVTDTDIFLFCPCDHVIKEKWAFRSSILRGINEIKNSNILMLFGVTPEYPESSYGYFQVNKYNDVLNFIEKPSAKILLDMMYSEQWIRTFWNTGIFMGTMQAFFNKYLPFMSNCPSNIPSGSFDSLFLSNKKTPLGTTMFNRADGWGWTDIGSWERLLRYIAMRDRE